LITWGDYELIKLTVNLKLFTIEVKEIQNTLNIELPEESKVIDLLYHLSLLFPMIKIIDEKRTSYVLCVVNNTAVTLNEVLKEGDRISILPLIDGG